MMQREEKNVAEPCGLCIQGPDDVKEWGEQSPGSNSEMPGGHLTHLPAQGLKLLLLLLSRFSYVRLCVTP